MRAISERKPTVRRFLGLALGDWSVFALGLLLVGVLIVLF
jgi:hypothetical protein